LGYDFEGGRISSFLSLLIFASALQCSARCGAALMLLSLPVIRKPIYGWPFTIK